MKAFEVWRLRIALGTPRMPVAGLAYNLFRLPYIIVQKGYFGNPYMGKVYSFLRI